ncbi:MAG: transcription elongation factor GreA [Deltaproteobacteria bacterium]|nr:transcription elongation factor GreA [Deltaproteobacteria bacterium]MCX7952473.1 transcription elongation factor GreA [Deltaproteobacteria bacterium]
MSEKILITKYGYSLLLEEYNRLKNFERVQVTKTIEWARSNGDLSENGDYIYAKRRLREIDERLSYISSRLQKFEVIDPSKPQGPIIQFGATVRVIDLDQGEEKVFILVGEDETNPEKGLISYTSPVGRALLGKEVGMIVEVETPRGTKEFEILEVVYSTLEEFFSG